jgi:hypothetical protein
VGISLSLRQALMNDRSHSSCVRVSRCTSISVVRPEGPPALLRPRWRRAVWRSKGVTVVSMSSKMGLVTGWRDVRKVDRSHWGCVSQLLKVGCDVCAEAGMRGFKRLWRCGGWLKPLWPRGRVRRRPKVASMIPSIPLNVEARFNVDVKKAPSLRRAKKEERRFEIRFWL